MNLDVDAPRILVVNAKTKTAMILHGRPPFGPANLYDFFRYMHKDSAKRLPDREIDGKIAIGFAAAVRITPFPPVEVNVWVDPDTDLPVRMESSEKGENGAVTTQVVMHDFRFDEEVDPELFSFEPPVGYTVQEYGQPELPPAPTDDEQLAPAVLPTVGLGPVRFGMTKEDVILLLGKPDKEEANGTALSYLSRGYAVYVSPRRGVTAYSCFSQATMAIRIRDFRGKTKEGIGIGSNVDDVKRAFGEPDSEEQNGQFNKSIRYFKLGLDLSLLNDKVVQFMVNDVRPREAE
jgi:hypothetical protein